MTGSEKQIEWAQEIRNTINIGSLAGKGRDAKGNELLGKIIAFIDAIEDSRFWIDYREYNAMRLGQELMGQGLQIKGFGFPDRTKMTLTGEFVNNNLFQDKTRKL